MADNIKEAYERFKHLDKILSDPDVAKNNSFNYTAHMLWLTVKAEATKVK